MIFYVMPFLFLSTVCFGMEQSSFQPMLNDIEERNLWELDFKKALIYADSSLLKQVVRSPYFSREYEIESTDLNGLMINPIYFCLLYTKKDARSDLLACIEILYNNGIPLIIPQKNIPETFLSPFMVVKNPEEFQLLLKLHVQEKEEIMDDCYLTKIGKNLLEVEVVEGITVFFDFISRPMDSLSLITLYKEYKPDILNGENPLNIAYLGFANKYVTCYALTHGLLQSDLTDALEMENNCNFIKTIAPFLIANGTIVYQKNDLGLYLNDIKFRILQIINEGRLYHINSSPVFQYLGKSFYRNCYLLHSKKINVKPLIDGIEKSIPSEEELIENAVLIALNLEANQSKTPSIRDVILKNKNPKNVLQALIARQYKK